MILAEVYLLVDILLFKIIVTLILSVLFFASGLAFIDKIVKTNRDSVRNLQELKTLDIKGSVKFLDSLCLVKIFVYARTLLYMAIFIQIHEFFKAVLSFSMNKNSPFNANGHSSCILLDGVVE